MSTTIAPPKGWTRAQVATSLARWKRKETYRHARWRGYVASRPIGDPARAKWHALWDEAVREAHRRTIQLAHFQDDNPFVLGHDEIAVIAEREGNTPWLYLDSRGFATFGVGHLVRMGDWTAADARKWGTKTRQKYTAEEAMTYFVKTDLVPYIKGVMATWHGAELPPTRPRVGACTSLSFNTGIAGFAASTVAKRIQAGDLHGAAAAFDLWRKPPEIIPRRNGEKAEMLAARGPYHARIT